MSLMRFSLDLAIPKSVYDAIPLAKKVAFRDMVRELKALSVRINAGSPNEEMTVRARYHLCLHNEGKQCGAEQDI